jgi:hypothetical protein
MLVLIPLYNMVRAYEYEFRKGTFLWIGSAFSHLYPQWLARSLAEFDIPLCLLYIVSFYLTSKITPMSMSADPVQQQQQKIMTIMMPLMFGWMMFSWRFPAAFTFYWLVLNNAVAARDGRWRRGLLRRRGRAPVRWQQGALRRRGRRALGWKRSPAGGGGERRAAEQREGRRAVPLRQALRLAQAVARRPRVDA